MDLLTLIMLAQHQPRRAIVISVGVSLKVRPWCAQCVESAVSSIKTPKIDQALLARMVLPWPDFRSPHECSECSATLEYHGDAWTADSRCAGAAESTPRVANR
jgi:hypothetical protein